MRLGLAGAQLGVRGHLAACAQHHNVAQHKLVRRHVCHFAAAHGLHRPLFQQGDETIDARKAILIEQRDQLIERMEDMQRSLDRLNYKIERYEQGLMVKEHQLRAQQDKEE